MMRKTFHPWDRAGPDVGKRMPPEAVVEKVVNALECRRANQAIGHVVVEAGKISIDPNMPTGFPDRLTPTDLERWIDRVANRLPK